MFIKRKRRLQEIQVFKTHQHMLHAKQHSSRCFNIIFVLELSKRVLPEVLSQNRSNTRLEPSQDWLHMRALILVFLGSFRLHGVLQNGFMQVRLTTPPAAQLSYPCPLPVGCGLPCYIDGLG